MSYSLIKTEQFGCPLLQGGFYPPIRRMGDRIWIDLGDLFGNQAS